MIYCKNAAYFIAVVVVFLLRIVPVHLNTRQQHPICTYGNMFYTRTHLH